jgi:hypothetical protein
MLASNPLEDLISPALDTVNGPNVLDGVEEALTLLGVLDAYLRLLTLMSSFMIRVLLSTRRLLAWYLECKNLQSSSKF